MLGLGIIVPPGATGSPSNTDTISPTPPGYERIYAIARAYMSRNDVTLSQALSMVWNNGGSDLVAGVTHSASSVVLGGAAFGSSPSGIGPVAFGALSVQQADAAIADYRRLFGTGDEQSARPLLNQGLTTLIGAPAANPVGAGMDFVTAVATAGIGLNAIAVNQAYRFGATSIETTNPSIRVAVNSTEVAGTREAFYRGDASRPTEFLSDIARTQGVGASDTMIANARTQGSTSAWFEMHAIDSQGSPYISITTSREVAESFARGPSGTQAGFVTEFRLPRGFAEPNFENAIPWEREYLAPTRIDREFIVNQYPVPPKKP